MGDVKMANTHSITVDSLPELLKGDVSVKVAAQDLDGVLRGKIMSKKKFLSIAKDGYGLCSVVFGVDINDTLYFKELKISTRERGWRDIICVPDLNTFRRIPWENNIPFFLCSFVDPETMRPLSACPRSLLQTAVSKINKHGYGAMAGSEIEFANFRVPQANPNVPLEERSTSIATFLQNNPVNALPSISEGVVAYSLTRPVQNKNYYYGIFDAANQFDCNIESWHTEFGPGIYEAALEFQKVTEMADRVALFKWTCKSIGSQYGITPCFMAKPRVGVPGCSAHQHMSLVDEKTGQNLFTREKEDTKAKYDDLRHISDIGRQFLAGILHGLPDIMPCLAPTINSYKRLVENYWAPVTVSWGLEHRSAAVRVIAPPSCSPGSTRFEVRVAGADANPHLVTAAILACGWRGVEKKMEIPCPPLGKGEDVSTSGVRLPNSLKQANEQMARKGSVAREVFGDDFVDHFAGSREHEVKLWEETVTDWEMKRYIEFV